MHTCSIHHTKNVFKKPTQKLSKSSKFVLEGYYYFKSIKLADVPPSELTVSVGSDAHATRAKERYAISAMCH